MASGSCVCYRKFNSMVILSTTRSSLDSHSQTPCSSDWFIMMSNDDTEPQVSSCGYSTNVQTEPHWTLPKFKNQPFPYVRHSWGDGVWRRKGTFSHQPETLKSHPSTIHHLLPLTCLSLIPDSSESSSHTSSKSYLRQVCLMSMSAQLTKTCDHGQGTWTKAKGLYIIQSRARPLFSFLSLCEEEAFFLDNKTLFIQSTLNKPDEKRFKTFLQMC